MGQFSPWFTEQVRVSAKHCFGSLCSQQGEDDYRGGQIVLLVDAWLRALRFFTLKRRGGWEQEQEISGAGNKTFSF